MYFGWQVICVESVDPEHLRDKEWRENDNDVVDGDSWRSIRGDAGEELDVERTRSSIEIDVLIKSILNL